MGGSCERCARPMIYPLAKGAPEPAAFCPTCASVLWRRRRPSGVVVARPLPKPDRCRSERTLTAATLAVLAFRLRQASEEGEADQACRSVSTELLNLSNRLVPPAKDNA